MSRCDERTAGAYCAFDRITGTRLPKSPRAGKKRKPNLAVVRWLERFRHEFRFAADTLNSGFKEFRTGGLRQTSRWTLVLHPRSNLQPSAHAPIFRDVRRVSPLAAFGELIRRSQ